MVNISIFIPVIGTKATMVPSGDNCASMAPESRPTADPDPSSTVKVEGCCCCCCVLLPPLDRPLTFELCRSTVFVIVWWCRLRRRLFRQQQQHSLFLGPEDAPCPHWWLCVWVFILQTCLLHERRMRHDSTAGQLSGKSLWISGWFSVHGRASTRATCIQRAQLWTISTCASTWKCSIHLQVIGFFPDLPDICPAEPRRICTIVRQKRINHLS